MEWILDSIEKKYLYAYDITIIALLECSENVLLSQQMVYEVWKLELYLAYLFWMTFQFPTLTYYRPILIFYITEIEKCKSTYQEQVFSSQQDSTINKFFLNYSWSEYRQGLLSDIQDLYDDFRDLRSHLCDLMSDGKFFLDHQNINDFMYDLDDIYEHMDRCKDYMDECSSYWLENPLLWYIYAMLIGYSCVLYPPFIHGIITSRTDIDYDKFIKKDSFNRSLQNDYFVESMKSMYGSLWGSCTTDYDPSRRFYYKGTNSSYLSYLYHYIPVAGQESSSIQWQQIIE